MIYNINWFILAAWKRTGDTWYVGTPRIFEHSWTMGSRVFVRKMFLSVFLTWHYKRYCWIYCPVRPWLEISMKVIWECPVWPETRPGSARSVPRGVRILALISNLCLWYNFSPIHLKYLTRLSLPKESTGRKNPLPQFACTHQLPATL